jgi:hypothetical protein
MKYYHLITGAKCTFDEMVLECQENVSSDTTTKLFWGEESDDERTFRCFSLQDISDLSGFNIIGDDDIGYCLSDSYKND